MVDRGRSWDKLPQGQGGLRTGKPQGTSVQNGQGLVKVEEWAGRWCTAPWEEAGWGVDRREVMDRVPT